MRRVGFVGLGVMGTPIARNLVRAGQPLLVWNRSPAAAETLRAQGAEVAGGVEDLFDRSDVVLIMLANGEVVDAVLGRGTARFEELVRGRLVVPMGTTSPAYSEALGRDVVRAGGRYAEAPVSGSRVPAEQGRLVAMLGGEDADLDVVEPLLTPACASVVRCGPVPSGLRMKLAVNLYLVTTVCGLVESYHFAEQLGLDLDRFVAVLDGGQMASPISRTKLAKLRAGDLSVQAAIADVLYNARLITDAATGAGVSTPLATVSEALYAEAEALGHGALDMAGVIRAVEARSAGLTSAPPAALSS
ncbi:MAG TPA: NAD(P)-dependent oxidoreductase [Lapillicoccus sp.]|nr:NAD(P)-dependent oxidoreductase [Lapillicoccus sp.]